MMMSNRFFISILPSASASTSLQQITKCYCVYRTQFSQSIRKNGRKKNYFPQYKTFTVFIKSERLHTCMPCLRITNTNV